MVGTLQSASNALVPTTTAWPSATPLAPAPVTDWKLSTIGTGAPRAPAARTIAAASGCCDDASTAAISPSAVDSSNGLPGASTTSVTLGAPSVMVPVLSRITVVMSPARCSASPPLISSPSSAPFPVATITAVGTARPIAQGQAMISTATPAAMPRTAPPSPPTSAQVIAVSSARTITTGTKMPLIRSASAWIGARDPCASRISWTIRASNDSAPRVVARTRSAPVPFMVPPITRAPACFITGSDSPVSIDSSTALSPPITSPSTAMRSPGRTTITSPCRTASIGTSTSPSGRTTRAVAGCSAASDRSAVAVFRLARASRALPASTKAMISTTAS